MSDSETDSYGLSQNGRFSSDEPEDTVPIEGAHLVSEPLTFNDEVPPTASPVPVAQLQSIRPLQVHPGRSLGRGRGYLRTPPRPPVRTPEPPSANVEPSVRSQGIPIPEPPREGFGPPPSQRVQRPFTLPAPVFTEQEYVREVYNTPVNIGETAHSGHPLRGIEGYEEVSDKLPVRAQTYLAELLEKQKQEKLDEDSKLALELLLASKRTFTVVPTDQCRKELFPERHATMNLNDSQDPEDMATMPGHLIDSPEATVLVDENSDMRQGAAAVSTSTQQPLTQMPPAVPEVPPGSKIGVGAKRKGGTVRAPKPLKSETKRRYYSHPPRIKLTIKSIPVGDLTDPSYDGSPQRNTVDMQGRLTNYDALGKPLEIQQSVRPVGVPAALGQYQTTDGCYVQDNPTTADPKSTPRKCRDDNTHLPSPEVLGPNVAHPSVGCRVPGCDAESKPQIRPHLENHWFRIHCAYSAFIPCPSPDCANRVFRLKPHYQIHRHLMDHHGWTKEEVDARKNELCLLRPQRNGLYYPVNWYVNPHYVDPQGIKPPPDPKWQNEIITGTTTEEIGPLLVWLNRYTINRWPNFWDLKQGTGCVNVTEDAARLPWLRIPTADPRTQAWQDNPTYGPDPFTMPICKTCLPPPEYDRPLIGIEEPRRELATDVPLPVDLRSPSTSRPQPNSVPPSEDLIPGDQIARLCRQGQVQIIPVESTTGQAIAQPSDSGLDIVDSEPYKKPRYVAAETGGVAGIAIPEGRPIRKTLKDQKKGVIQESTVEELFDQASIYQAVPPEEAERLQRELLARYQPRAGILDTAPPAMDVDPASKFKTRFEKACAHNAPVGSYEFVYDEDVIERKLMPQAMQELVPMQRYLNQLFTETQTGINNMLKFMNYQQQYYLALQAHSKFWLAEAKAAQKRYCEASFEADQVEQGSKQKQDQAVQDRAKMQAEMTKLQQDLETLTVKMNKQEAGRFQIAREAVLLGRKEKALTKDLENQRQIIKALKAKQTELRENLRAVRRERDALKAAKGEPTTRAPTPGVPLGQDPEHPITLPSSSDDVTDEEVRALLDQYDN